VPLWTPYLFLIGFLNKQEAPFIKNGWGQYTENSDCPSLFPDLAGKQAALVTMILLNLVPFYGIPGISVSFRRPVADKLQVFVMPIRVSRRPNKPLLLSIVLLHDLDAVLGSMFSYPRKHHLPRGIQWSPLLEKPYPR